MFYLIHYNEIGLKQKNIGFFENKLIENIKKKIKTKSIKKIQKRIILETNENVEEKLKTIFGIEWFAECWLFNEYEKIKEFNFKIKESFKVITKRAYKKFEMTSMDINKDLGAYIVEEYNKKVSMKNPETKIYLEVLKNLFILYFKKIPGPGGLPLGSSGKGIVLFSGGIDSPVATYLMMKRGMKLELLHFHSLPIEKVKKSKIIELYNILKRYDPDLKINFIHFKFFYEISEKIPKKYRGFIFRKFIYMVADKLGDVIISGDALSQVASQTIDNLKIINKGIDALILRPLIGFDKKEIIEIAKKIGTYEASIKEYKDTCSFLSTSPITKAKGEKVKEIIEKINIEKIIEESIQSFANK